MGDELEKGRWGDEFPLSNVAIHLSLLPNGNVLYWGRRPARELTDASVNTTLESLNRRVTETYILDIKSSNKESILTEEPKDQDGNQINLFCAGHCFQPDGTLLVVGGHDGQDGKGLDQACTFDWRDEKWTPIKPGSGGRWYPTLIPRPDGSTVVISGSATDFNANLVSQVWDGTDWKSLTTPEAGVFGLYPRLFNAPQNQVFIAGPLRTSRFLDLNANAGAGSWSASADSPDREANREYAASAMYRPGKVIYISGGGGDDEAPTQIVQQIDLNSSTTPLKWETASNIQTPRRHHFATVLPDGTVLVTGGTKAAGFNTVGPPNEVHEPELWTPGNAVTDPGTWTEMAPEKTGRCYHHTALLLRDGTVLSAGSGEWDPSKIAFSHKTAQIFSPPYMFKGNAPTLTNAPTEIEYAEPFTVTVGAGDQIQTVSLVRLGSVTHCVNMNQAFMILEFTQRGNELEIEGPAESTYMPPGHYMLFIMSATDNVGEVGKPAAEAPILRLKLKPELPIPAASRLRLELRRRTAAESQVGITLGMRNEQLIATQHRPPVVIGLTPVCPYGLGPCWAGAYEALRSIKDIAAVRPKPSQDDSVAFVYLKEDILPDIDAWRAQLKVVDGGAYQMRGLEVTLSGVVTRTDGGEIELAGPWGQSPVVLSPFGPGSTIAWDHRNKVARPVKEGETGAYANLAKKVVNYQSGLEVDMTGRLHKLEGGKFSLDVKKFTISSYGAWGWLLLVDMLQTIRRLIYG